MKNVSLERVCDEATSFGAKMRMTGNLDRDAVTMLPGSKCQEDRMASGKFTLNSSCNMSWCGVVRYVHLGSSH